MATQQLSLLTLTVKATAAITKKRFVLQAGTIASAAGNALGVAETNAAIGDYFPVVVIGTAIVEAGAAVAKDVQIEIDASGRAITKASGIVVGRSLESAAAAGQLFEILLIQN